MGKTRTPEEREQVKKQRLLEKAMRMPINNVVLQVQDGTISLTDLIGRIEEKVKEAIKHGKVS